MKSKSISNNLMDLLKRLGINKDTQTIQDLITRILHLIPAIIKDGHCISFGKPGAGKTTLIEKSTSKVKNITKMSSASFFGNLKQVKEIPYCSDENYVAYIEQASYLSKINDDELINNILTHCNGNKVNRVKKEENLEDKVRTSIVLLGNYEEDVFKYNILEDKFCLEKYIDKLPNELKEKQGLERFIILPSFLLEKLSIDSFINLSEKSSLELERIDFLEYDYLKEEDNIRIYKQKCKIVTALNYLLNNEAEYTNSYIFDGFKSIANSIVNLANNEYKPFYKELSGKFLLLDLIKIYFSEDKQLEEAHIFNHRALLKFKNEKIWYKLALDSIGREENEIEYKFFNSDMNTEIIANIVSIENNGLLLKQEYYKLQSDYYKVSTSNLNDDSFARDLLVETLNSEVKDLKNEIKFLKRVVKDIIENYNMHMVYDCKGSKNKIKDYFMEINPKQEILNRLSAYQSYLQVTKSDLKKSDIGLKDEIYKLVNFVDYLDRDYLEREFILKKIKIKS